MSRKQAIAKMQDILINRRNALRQALAGDLSTLTKLRETTTGDVVDAALDSVQDEISSQLAEVESRELSSIENALERMREGEYGACEACGGNIPLTRLQILPYATFCINCQQEAEKRGINPNQLVDWGRIAEVSSNDTEVSFSDLELDVS